MTELISSPEDAALWLAAADGRPDWERLFANYQSSVDYPGCTLWRDLAAAFPDAKIVLTRRDPDKWYESLRATIFSDGWIAASRSLPIGEFFDRLVYAPFGDRIGDHDFMVDYFRRWNERVIAEVPPDRLLVFEAADGWERLCAFLGVAVPDAPYPHVNTRAQAQAVLAQRAASGFDDEGAIRARVRDMLINPAEPPARS